MADVDLAAYLASKKAPVASGIRTSKPVKEPSDEEALALDINKNPTDLSKLGPSQTALAKMPAPSMDLGAYLASKQQATPNSTPAPTSTQTVPDVGSMTEGVNPEAPPTNVSAMDTLNQLKDQYVAPVGQWLQKNVGKPVAKAVGNTVFGSSPLQDVSGRGTERAIDKPPNPVEGLTQAATSLIHGTDVKSQEMRSAIGRLVGPDNVDTAIGGAHFFGNSLGWLLLPGSLELEAGKDAGILAKLGTAFLNGSANGAYGQVVSNALTSGKSLTEDVGTSALEQGSLFALARAGAEGGKKLIGILPKDAIENLGQELSDLWGNRAEEVKPKGLDESLLSKEDRETTGINSNGGNSPPISSKEVTNPGSPKIAKLQQIKIAKAADAPKTFNPFIGVVSHDEKGFPQLDLHEVKFEDGAVKPRTVRLPVQDDLDAIKLRQYLKDKDIPLIKNNGESFDDMGPLWNKNVFGESGESPNVPYEMSTGNDNKLQANALTTKTPDDVINPGDTVDIHEPGKPVRQAEVAGIADGKIHTTEGDELNPAQVTKAHDLPEKDNGPTAPETGAGHTVQPHEQVTPGPLPAHRTPLPGEMPNTLLDNVSQGLNHLKSDVAAIKNHFLQPSMSLGLPVNAQSIALAIHGESTQRELRSIFINSMLAATGKKNPSPEFGQALEKFALAADKPSQSAALKALESHPEWSAGKDYFNRLLLSRTLKSNEMDNMMMKAGFGPMAKEGEGLGDQYMTRMFMANMDIPWAKQARALDLVEPAVKELMAKDSNMPEHVIRSWVDNALQGKSTWDTLSAQMQTSGSKAFKNLKSRQDLGPATRAMLGEVHDGITRLAYSHAAQDGILAHLKNMEALSQDIEVFSKNMVQGWEKLPGTRQWGAAAGGYVRPDVYDAIKVNPMTTPPDSIVRKLTGLMKGWQVNPITAGLGALTSHVYNSELLGMMGARSNNPVAIARDIATAHNALRSYAKDPLGTGDGEIAKLARDLGIVKSYSSFWNIKDNASRIMDNHIDSLNKHAFSDQPMDWVDQMKHVNRTAQDIGARTIGELNDVGKNFYDHTIQSLRLSSFIGARRELLTRDADGLYSTLAREMSQVGATMMPKKFSQWARSDVENLANRLAARRVTLSTSNPQTMAPIAQKISQSAAGQGVTFMTPLAETARVLSQMPVRFKQDANYRYRLAGWATMLGSIYAARRAVQFLHGGMSSEVLDDAYKNAPDSWKGSHPFAAYMPSMYAGVTRDSKGRVVFGDSALPTTQVIEELFRASNPQDAGSSAALVQNMADHFWPGKGRDLQDVMSRTGVTQPTPNVKPRPGEGAMMNLVNTVATLANHSMAPRSLNNFGQAARGLGLTRDIQPNQEQLTVPQAVGRAAGVSKPVPVGEASELARNQERNARVKGAKRALYNPNLNEGERAGAVQHLQEEVNK